MGGIAVIVDWQRPVSARQLRPMLDLVPHRSTGGVDQAAFEHAALAGTSAQTGATDAPLAATVGHLAIVGDLRLWNRDSLRSRAGGQSATTGMSDLRLILEAYRRTGIKALDDVDGDFAFVIWDEREQRIVAVRDRFAMKPLFFERTPSGIRFASEPKMLVSTSIRSIEPCSRSIAEYLAGNYQESRNTFFKGIERIRPSTALIADPTGESEVRYWMPNSRTVPAPPTGDVAGEFREHLAQGVRRRIATSMATVSHLSGGLDSSAIAAAAHVSRDREQLPAPFHTVSAVFAGHTIDESKWIDEITAIQPFPHHSFTPRVADIEAFEHDMWISDQPRVNRIRDMWSETAAIGTSVGADLVFAGIGGDEVLDQSQLFIDRLRSGTYAQRLRDIRAQTAWSGRGLVDAAVEVARDGLPASVKQSLKRLMPRRERGPADLIRQELLESLELHPVDPASFDFDLPSITQVGVVASTQHPSLVSLNEVQEAEYASLGIGLSQPYLDRDLVEYVASISPKIRPFDGRSKTLNRTGFAGWLPPSVLDRRTKTVADDYLDALLDLHYDQYRGRYPEVSERALPYIESARYLVLLDEARSGSPGFVTRESLWSAWTVMSFLDGLGRYRP